MSIELTPLAPPQVDYLQVLGVNLEVKRISGRRPGPTLVLLHEGLGCIDAWREFPELLALVTDLPVFVYSRQGYGRSQACELPRPLDYMHHEALVVLPELLRVAGIEDYVLIGHSDGGSIALIHAGGAQRNGLQALAVIAAHVFCEEVSVRSIAKIKTAYEQTEIRQGLYKYHGDNTDGAFWGWNQAWLHPDFMQWNIEQFLHPINQPLLVIQGRDDEYGSLAQVEAIAGQAQGEVEVCLLDDCGHFPQKTQLIATLTALKAFLSRFLEPKSSV